MADYLTYQGIYTKIARIGGDLNQSWIDKAKDVINMVYMNEVLCADDLYPTLFFLVFPDDSIKAKSSATITGISKAATAVVTAAAHGYENGDIVSIGDVGGMTEVNDRIFVVANKAAGTFELNTLDGAAVASTAYTTYTSGGTIKHRGVTPSTSIERVLSASWHGQSTMMEPCSERDLEDKASWWDATSTSVPNRYMVRKYYDSEGAEVNRILWFPLPTDNYRLRYWYEQRVSPLSADGDVPILPPRFHNLLVTGSLARLIEYGGAQVENAVIWPALYKAQLDALKTTNRRWWRQFEKDERSPLYLA